MIRTSIFILVALLAAPAFASDLPADAKPAKAAAPAPAPSPTTTIGIEISPEFKTTDNSLADGYFKGSISESLGNGFSLGSSLQLVDKFPTSTYQALLDASVAYKAKLNDNFSVTLTGGLGYTWGNTGYTGGVANKTGVDPVLYYFATAALDDKLDANWTWNIVNVRYRNAFSVTWLTPKIQTGITYNIDKTDAVYANIGYGWKDSGSGLAGDKWNVAVGYKYSF